MYARLSFWYHIPFEQIDRMPLAAINAYLDELPGLLAEWRLQMMEATTLPHVRESARRAAWRETRRLAYGDETAQVVARPSPAMLALLGIGVQVVKTDG